MADNESQTTGPTSPAPPSASDISITFTHHGTPYTLTFPPSATITDLSTHISTTLSIPLANQKFIINPKPGLLKPPFPDPSLLLSTLKNRKITLLAPTPTDLTTLSKPHPPTRHSSPLKPATPTPHRDWKKTHDSTTYTFHKLLPLSHLPNSSRSLAFLQRLKADPGILHAMSTHHFSVPILTEMDPAAHTTHDSRTLGLNRNKGEVIELRLRTDAYDGYRDYKIIRDTLCHELAHCVHGEHDRHFWDLCKEIEKEVRAHDWKSGGRAVSEEVFYDPKGSEGAGEHVDGGGWTGGEYVLGGTGGSSRAPAQTMSRREAMAKAAEERMKRQREAGGGGSGASA